MRNIIMILIGSAILLGCGGGDITQTGRDYGFDVAEAACPVRVACGFAFTVDGCVNGTVQDVCEAMPGACMSEYTVPADAWDACLNAISDMRCIDIENSVFPGECFVNELNPIYDLLV